MLTGIGTVLADNPRLDVRLVETSRQPTLVVMERHHPIDMIEKQDGVSLLINS